MDNLRTRALRHRLPVVAGVFVGLCWLIQGAIGQPQPPEGVVPPVRPCHLKGEKTTFLVVSNSTQYNWPEILQDLLDEHAGQKGVYFVVDASVEGANVKDWIASPSEAAYKNTFEPMIENYYGDAPKKLGDAPRPRFALCQQSLRGIGGDLGPVEDPKNEPALNTAADAYEKLARRLRDAGIEKVFIAGNYYQAPEEPYAQNEQRAVGQLMLRKLDFALAGPDIWYPTKRFKDKAFEADGVTLSPFGVKTLAQGWYRILAGNEANSAAIKRMLAKDYGSDKATTQPSGRGPTPTSQPASTTQPVKIKPLVK